jgi:hypothetical protein
VQVGADKYQAKGIGGFTEKFQKEADELNDKLNPFSELEKQVGQIPFYQTGARAFIKVGGKPLAVCQDFRWQVSYQPNPIYTIDTVQPWDIDVGPMTVSATLSQIMDPTKGPEVDHLLPIMSSAVHQPLVELQVLDRLGTSLFFARGMFLSVSGSIARGAVSSFTATFTGTAYQHYVAQSFKPYNSIAGGRTRLRPDGRPGLTHPGRPGQWRLTTTYPACDSLRPSSLSEQSWRPPGDLVRPTEVLL